MQIGGLGSYNSYGYAQQLLDQNASATNNSNGSTGNSKTGSASNTTSYLSTSGLKDLTTLISSIMDTMGLGKNDPVSFGQITAYKQKLEKEYGDKLEKDLAELGVDKSIKFQLQLDKNGKMQVTSDHPDKDKVQKYFDDNPEMVKKYKEIQGLADLDNARKQMQVDPTSMKKRIQVESMAAWWQDVGSASSSIGDFSGGDMSFYKGINTTV